MLDRIPPVVLVGIGGLLGAISRYVIVNLLSEYKLIPIGTLLVNVVGSFALGALLTLFSLEIIHSSWIPLVGVGFMGSFTTMSSFAVETLDLSSNHSFELAFINFLVMMIFVFIGALMGRTLVLFLFSSQQLMT